ncbi:uncharacterized protein Gasu_08810 [Galdieria sulphuraria]|uniref:Conserved oligomeric Golgi complex subunit 8 n=1 Tax=Galdieria sulphuraria TaxID=130081 RepID=M2Y6Z7_GALSU|nr:uncharacterized protein Gasu_08810 [Galdieria sulphuraria]EME31803.1 hypothetical protein Gasu_08810 [Galdieria sulphuraria]|eukprot:XP_005708323.1 hypothetical protein Gasu_08810 [Galdieria sulphuraria]
MEIGPDFDKGEGLDDLESLKKEAYEAGLSSFLERVLASSRKQVSADVSEVEGEVDKLSTQLQDIVSRNYRDLLQNYDQSVSSSSTLRNLQEVLGKVSQSFPLFVDKSIEALKVLNLSQQERESYSSDVSDIYVNDLIELPSLVVSLIRAGEIEASVEMIEHSRRLNLLISGSRILNDVCYRVKDMRLLVVSYILQRLRSKTSLSECLRLITLLRRITSLDEVVLRLLFLCCRSHWMLSCLKGFCNPKPQSLFAQFSDEFRIRTLETTTQYHAIFTDIASRDTIHDDFINLWISFYLQVTKRHLCNITDGGTLSSLIQQANYCGESLSRIGADFRMLLCIPFEEASVLLFSKSLQEALLAFETMLESFQWYPSTSSLKLTESTGQHDIPGVSLPYQLLEFPPLSVLFNGILSALNEIRQVVFNSQKKTYAELLQNTFYEAAAVVKDFGGSRGSLLPNSQLY